MNNTNRDNAKGMSAIIDGVDFLIDKKIQKSPFDRTLSGKVTYADYSSNTYNVKINDYIYQNISSTIKANVGDTVFVKCPQNQTSQMYIDKKIDDTDYTENLYDDNVEFTLDSNEFKGILVGKEYPIMATFQLQSSSIYMVVVAGYTLSNTNPPQNYGGITYIINTALNNNSIPTMYMLGNTVSSLGVHVLTRNILTIENSAMQQINFSISKIF